MLGFMKFEFGAIKRGRQELSVTVEGVRAGYLLLGVANVDDQEHPKIELDYAEVDEPFRGTDLSVALVREVRAHWPRARIVGGPLHDDDGPGPRFRLRCWDAGIEIHRPHCKSQACECRARIVEEVAKRYQELFATGGLTSDELEERLAPLKVKPA